MCYKKPIELAFVKWALAVSRFHLQEACNYYFSPTPAFASTERCNNSKQNCLPLGRFVDVSNKHATRFSSIPVHSNFDVNR